MKILISTGNKDKFKRIADWIESDEFETVNFKDIDPETAKLAKLTDEEELKFDSMQERALAKVKKPWSVLEDFIIFGTDESAYFPWFDTELLNLRKPPMITTGGKLIYKGTDERLRGAELANTYSRIVDTVATDILMERELNKLGIHEVPPYKFMPIEWRFTLVGATHRERPSIICNWKWRQYITNLKLPENEPDTGYMIGKISVDTPGGIVGLKGKVESEEKPRIAINKFLDKYT